MLGLSIGIMGSGAYVNWKLGKVWDQGSKSIFVQLLQDRAEDINELMKSTNELQQLHTSAGGLLRKLTELKGQIERSIDGLGPLRKELRLDAIEMPSAAPMAAAEADVAG